ARRPPVLIVSMDAGLIRPRLATGAQSPPSRSCPQQQRSVVRCALESFHLVASFECIPGNIRRRRYPAIPNTATRRIQPLLLSGFAAGFPNRGSLLSCGLVRCAPIRETLSLQASEQRD